MTNWGVCAVASWQLGGLANATVSAAYLLIAAIVAQGLVRSGQLRTNALGVATAAIFFSCGIGHGLHAVHLLVPMDMEGMRGGMRSGWTLDMTLWDALTACVAVTYLTLRTRYGQLLNTPQMFRDEVERERSATIRQVLERVDESVVVLRDDGRVEHLNRKATALLGSFSTGPLDVGRPLEEALPAFRAIVTDGLAEGRETEDEAFEVVDTAGRQRRLAVSLRMLEEGASRPQRWVLACADVTETVEAREALRASEVRHRMTVESLHEGVVLQGVDGAIQTANARATELLGLSLDQLVGRTSIDARWRAVHEDGSPWPGQEHPVPRALASGVRVGPETMGIHTPDGRLRWLEVNAVPILEEGRVRAAVASFVDVTARRQAEERLATSEAQLRATLAGLAEGVVLYDEELVMRSINPAGAEMLGLPETVLPGLALGESAVTVLDADGRPMDCEQWPVRVAQRERRRISGVTLGLRQSGQPVRWVEANAAPLERALHKDAVPAVVASFMDVTDRLARERALVEAEQRVRSTFDAAPVGMVVAKLDGVIVEANQALADLLGTTVEDVLGTRREDATHPEDIQEQLEGERRLLAGEQQTFRMEKRYLHAAGHTLWTQLDLTVLRDADGEPVGTVAQIQDVSERRRHEAQLRHLADHDALTGLLNRRGFGRELERHLLHTERYGTGGALLMLDLDHFKYVNDTLGHKAGDELIIAVADMLAKRLRRSDVIARLGGDEFAVLLPRANAAEARRVADTLVHALRDRQSALPTLGRLKLTASVGVTTIEERGVTADELLVNADLAMYDAKEAGRDQVAGYADGQHQQPRIKARMTWMERITEALEHDRFELMAQPIQRLADDEVVLHELLLRMRSPDGDLIPPATFLYIAERFELIQEIDRWVIDHGCGLLARSSTPVSINLSARSLNDPDRVLDHIDRALRRTGAKPHDLVIEITETAAVSQIQNARAFAQELQALGCRLAIDDFGAGFGSFYYLKHLPFDFLKIDGEFVSNARTSRPDALIVRALRDLAHGMERQVIAEWCTDEPTLAYLRNEGIDLAQGYHLGRPRPAAVVLDIEAPTG